MSGPDPKFIGNDHPKNNPDERLKLICTGFAKCPGTFVPTVNELGLLEAVVQTNFFPTFLQVSCFFAVPVVAPALMHFPPALAAATTSAVAKEKVRNRQMHTAKLRNLITTSAYMPHIASNSSTVLSPDKARV